MEQELLRRLPKMDRLLAHPALAESGLPYHARKAAARAVLDQLRANLHSGAAVDLPGLDALAEAAARTAQDFCRPSLRRVVNATGVVLHTNLGRAPLSRRAAQAAYEAALGYSNLEYDLERGVRGGRQEHTADLLRALTGAEGALCVNNNASAVFLMLAALACGKGVAISRGELVEIGGSFRIPDIMARSGARLVEVGTTNKTRVQDYAAALDSGAVQVLLKVHPSNFKVVGFTQEASLEELSALGRARNVPVLFDLGSGALRPGGPWPASYPTLTESLRWADVVCCSADKLLGGPQAGIAAGRRAAIAAMARDPFARVVRPDKLTLAALEATLRAWQDPEEARALPVPAMLGAGPAQLEARAMALAERLSPFCPCTVVHTQGQVGGGALPDETLAAWAVELPAGLEEPLRRWEVPVLGRVHRGKLLLDVRTLLPGDEDVVAAAVAHGAGGEP